MVHVVPPPPPTRNSSPRPDTTTSELFLAWRARLAKRLLVVGSLLAVPTGAVVVWQHVQQDHPAAASGVVLLCLTVVWGALAQGVHWRHRARIALGATYTAAALSILTMGMSGGAFASLSAFVVLSAVLLGRRSVLPAMGLSVATVGAAAVLHHTGVLVAPFAAMVEPTSALNWLRVSGFWLAVTVGAAGSVVFVLQELSSALDQQARLVGELRAEMAERERAHHELDRTRERLAQSHKLEALGRLAGGVAHDFNNTLTVILSSAELLSTEVGDDPQLQRLVRHMQDASEQGAALTQQLLSLSRGRVSRPEVVNVARLVQQTCELLQRVLPSDVRVHPPDRHQTLYVRVDPSQLHQALLNLGINARDAMPQGGDLHLELSLASLGDKNTAGLIAGEYVCLRVRDTGTGIEPGVIDRIFEPFFTTKGEGHGTGLGLANVRDMAKSAGGGLTVSSQQGAGTAFCLYLPEVERRVSGVDALLKSGAGAATALVIDDDPQVRSLLTVMLTGMGHRILQAATAKQGLQLLRDHGAGVDVMFMDPTIGDLPARALVQEARNTVHQLPVVVCSAFNPDDYLRSEVLAGRVLALNKPFTREQLETTTARALQRRSLPEVFEQGHPR